MMRTRLGAEKKSSSHGQLQFERATSTKTLSPPSHLHECLVRSDFPSHDPTHGGASGDRVLVTVDWE